MTPRHFLDIWRAEISKLFSRASARAGLVIAAIVAVCGPLFLFMASRADVTMNGKQVSTGLQLTGAMGLQWALELRNDSQILRALILMLVALSVAGEYRARTIREDLIRPVPRWAVPLGKWLAIDVWILASLLVAWVFGGLLSTIAYGAGGAWGNLMLGYGATFLADAGFAALVLLISVLSRSVAGTIAGVFVYLILDTVLGWTLWLVSKLSGIIHLSKSIEYAVALRPWLPSSAFGVWSGYAARNPWEWRSFVSLAIITVVCLVVGERFFHRLDVP